MTEYNPDCWVILEITNSTQTYYKVLAGWSGSYLYGSSWKLNSGIVDVEEDKSHYHFVGASGSVYNCNKETEGLRLSIAPTYNAMKDKFGSLVKIVEYKDIDKEKFLNADPSCVII